MLVVVALGGNALLRRGEALTAESQDRNVREAARVLAPLAAEHELVVTHGNGPQVGLLALQTEAIEDAPSYPLDVLGAETEGMIGYLLARELRGSVQNQEVATLLTQVEVDPGDAAFQSPSKPIGPSYPASRASELAEDRGWTFVEESKGGFRRVVPSPEPQAILEVEVIRLLVSAGVLVTCAGGGGIPVARSADGTLYGVEAVVDKDLASGLLAARLGADFLLLLTDQPGVYADWPEPAAQLVENTTVEALRGCTFEKGTMGPKVEAACRFVASTRGSAAIGELSDAAKILDGNAGTRISLG
ncbi:MAG: carbamate kinase [Myxococcales bacterium]|nr:carbamate kinase [Myxococcales bacterium]